MTRVSRISTGALRARLILAVEGCAGLQGSPYLLAIGALSLAAEPESAFEQGLWASLFELQADEERVNGAELLKTLASVTELVS